MFNIQEVSIIILTSFHTQVDENIGKLFYLCVTGEILTLVQSPYYRI